MNLPPPDLEFDTILGLIATSNSMTGGKGTYSLRDKCWNEYEGRNFLHYTSQELQESLNRFQDWNKKQHDNQKFPRVQTDVQKSLPPEFQTTLSNYFYPLETALPNCHLIHQLLFSVLYNALTQSKTSTETLLEQTLILLLHCIQVSQPNEGEDVVVTTMQNRFFPTENIFYNIRHEKQTKKKGNISILLMVSEMNTSGEHLEAKGIIMEILTVLSSKSQKCANIISSISEKKAVKPVVEQEEDRKSLAAQRKAQLLAQFEAQRKAFQTSLGDEEDFDDEEVNEGKEEQPEELGMVSTIGERGKV
jgi:hypothetical protein